MVRKGQDQESKDKHTASARYEIEPLCEFCGEYNGLRLESSRTSYHWDGEFDSPKDPNRDKLLCRKCAQMHHKFWDDMWTQYQDCR
jgi:hypothetical protein